MYQTLFHIPSHIYGIPVFGCGLLLAAWGLFSIGLLAWLWRRQGFDADTLGYLPLLGLVGAIIWWLLPTLVHPPYGLPIRGYGVMMLLAVVCATALAVWRGRRVGIAADVIFSLAFWMFVPGIAGARLFYIIQDWSDKFEPAFQQGLFTGLGSLVNVAEGGLVVFGGFVGGVLGLVLYVRKQKLPLLAVCDLLAPSMILGQAIGRIGCLLNGCCHGGECDYRWAITFPRFTAEATLSPPYYEQLREGTLLGFRIGADRSGTPRIDWVAHGSQLDTAGIKPGDRLTAINGAAMDTAGEANRRLVDAVTEDQPLMLTIQGHPPLAVHPPPRSLPVHPAQIYSAVDAFLLCLLLLVYDPFHRRDGELFAWLLTVHPISRYLLEVIRGDDVPVWSLTGLRISQTVSLLLLACAAGLWFYILRRPRGLAFHGGDPNAKPLAAA